MDNDPIRIISTDGKHVGCVTGLHSVVEDYLVFKWFVVTWSEEEQSLVNPNSLVWFTNSIARIEEDYL